ncbi:EscU/YscU/HrcU family type III secretion system export apparatus switch protein [Microbulbifer thermotolerans]|uniref:EscU/YscU/HrcU family type III secretion system export apparatus switch protein n=1 Tax=Microbulbifer thermotolerans TaxID=252514 RepID=UPI0008E5DE47|nr:EscU/YscU/HrcU family type III secretion system export apparatus switch protein [Microbulbifer thermotolerans]MCX2783459.1 EscU/YscU/HrcU family type III secretion system export apparatus switch protein [Microbulbifer thermotolerans]MCX2836340.1 EscU/YscU/HrcU family type III secretion system export apparatus switch protein [Microbulbifer thermotolerans]SFC62800.1 flagellar biosynthesis protein [Microbulbifer thermotolerans]
MKESEERRRAVALAYRDGDVSPRVVARGYGELAERIVAEARRQGIYVHDAPELVALLMQLDIDERIPPRLYQVIAELLVWVRGLSSEELQREP